MTAHTSFATTTRGLRRDLPAMRLFEKAKRFGIWNPSDIDLSQDKRDWIIAGVGATLIILGVLLYRNVIPLDWARSLWWLPTAIGIVAFSWGFK